MPESAHSTGSAEEPEFGMVSEKAFRSAITSAINRELNLLRKNGISGRDLLKSLGQIYFQHNMRDWVESRNRQLADEEVPRIICSEGLM